MQNGIQDSLKQDIEKHSATLDRTAQYQKISKVSRLPQYLVVHFIRFFWKPSERVRAKILRKVKFPLDWDATDLCTPELQSKYSKVKAKLREVDDAKLEQERERKKRKTNEDLNDESAEKPSASTSMDVDTGSSEKVDWSQYVDEDLKNDIGANVTGQYELCSVLTHVGRSADSGNYIVYQCYRFYVHPVADILSPQVIISVGSRKEETNGSNTMTIKYLSWRTKTFKN